MHKILSVFALLCITLQTHAQVKLKFGKVSTEELQKEKSLIDEDASAEVLGEIGYLHFRFDPAKGLAYYFEYHKRIKIYNNAGYEYADISIPLRGRTGTDGETVGVIKAATYNLEGNKVVKTKLSNSDIIDEEVTDFLTLKKLSFPQVKEGSIIEYKYTMTSNYLGDVPDWTFQEDIPVVWSEYKFQIPEWYKFRPIAQGFVDFAINTQESGSGTDPAIPGATWVVNTSTWAVKDVAPLEEENYISSTENFVSKISFQMLSYRFPGGSLNEIARNYAKYNRRLVKSESFGKTLERNNFLAEDASRIAGNGSDSEKALSIYTYVRNNIAWDDFYGKYPTDVKKAYREKSGSVADINFLLVMMMRSAGLNADAVVLSTRSNGYPHPAYPNDDRFNYVIACVNLDDNLYLLDASAKGYPFGTLPVKCLNGQGWRVSETQPGWVNLQGRATSKTIARAKLNLHENGIIDGNMSVTSSGYSDISRRIDLFKKGEDDFVKDLDDELIEWSIDSADFENTDNVYSPLVTNYHLRNTENEESDIIYLNPLIINQYEDNPFEADSRVLPIDFPYGSSQQFVMEIILPEGYTVEELPEPTVFQLPGKGAMYQFSATSLGQKISIVNNLKINKLQYGVNEYEAIKKFFELMITKQGEQIVIKRI
ncbi:MAG: DUF3857 domain-containing protein [Cyclobacteriaceae bacterium]